jgi:hypothetical protein
MPRAQKRDYGRANPSQLAGTCRRQKVAECTADERGLNVARQVNEQQIGNGLETGGGSSRATLLPVSHINT